MQSSLEAKVAFVIGGGTVAVDGRGDVSHVLVVVARAVSLLSEVGDLSSQDLNKSEFSS